MSCGGCGGNVVTSFAKSIAKAAKALACGEDLIVSPEVMKARLKVCVGCERYQPPGAVLGPFCKKCKCLVKIKSWGAMWDCPEGKWPALVGKPLAGGDA